MATTSIIPDLIDALVTKATTALPDVNVYDGFGVSEDPGDFLMVGVEDPDDPRWAASASEEQEWATSDSSLDRKSSGYVTCAARSWLGDSGNDGQKAARDAAFAICDAVAAFCRDDITLGVSGLLWASYGTQQDLQQTQDSSGSVAQVLFRIDFMAYLATT